MRRELKYGMRSLRPRPLLALALWSVPEILPTALYGVAVAHAVDDGFLAGRPVIGLAWLGGLVLAAIVGAVGARQVYRLLGGLVEPFRDDLARRVVSGALERGVAGGRDDGAVSRLTRQVEVVRDTYAGLVLVLRTFVLTVAGVAAGLLTIDPMVALLVLPPFLLGLAASLGVIGLAAGRVRDSLRADEEVATTSGAVFSALRDVTAGGAEAHAATLVDGPIDAHAAAERALARVAALRMLCFVLGGWVPMLALLAAAPWLTGRGLTAGALLGGLTYVLVGLQPALGTVLAVLGDSGLRYVVTLRRILDAAPPPARPQMTQRARTGYDVVFHRVTFAYGPHSDAVLDRFDLTVPSGDHLAVVGPSGIGKSTLAGLVCGLLTPTAGEVLLGGDPITGQPAQQMAADRVLIPQEAYVFSGTVLDNLTYLSHGADAAQIDRAVEAVGAGALVRRLGGLAGQVRPGDLSAGERQLIALVRAYLSPAPVVVLDEATCHLDPEAERRAENAFAARGGTLVVVAHRISSALRARRVLVLDGERAAVGDHETLLRTSPLYRDLVGSWLPTDQIQPAS
ncbi:MAG: ABC transporter ATP-binding protein/permease [Actinomycetota bacterium]|nr:ABC transporter ATP-binding protein/permease [Actinomycetota bacterium]